ncbi:class II fructose-bisphosphate aldolase [Enterococcus sp. BWT-B8]|uniref:class II fructose-bisphosphate aldolase n=1 Tax=unclassified Enterococcus TaxID=2608891 RepID=UPI001E314CCB|nr:MULTISPECIES: class II fructose-bisphosphate aldolase [unclassified Enterococcus]MCB5952821.1 class II fructose-bisphosphate aldolase [Enterococcus sp. BWT-B8]MCB5953826.1 class II fructose-bisphosphate aldolase [Enterococcus sp. CWB-B31]
MLVTLKELLKDAKRTPYAVGAINVPNLEAIRAVVEAAEELNSPVILQHAEVHENLVRLEEIGPVMLDYARRAKVPVAVHLDHGASFDMCVQAIRLGFTSIMYDASSKPYAVNLAETKEIVKIAHAAEVSVEAELGHIFTSAVGGGEGRGSDSSEDYDDLEDVYTDPDMAKAFVEETGVDCLAIGFGTVHGIYLKEPKLDLDRILQIKNKIDIPFVMHGGSGVSEADYKMAIRNGICKINYYTYMNKAGGKGVIKCLKKMIAGETVFFDELSLAATAEMKKNVKEAMKIFMNP